MTNTVIATVPIGQAPQAVTYVPNAVPEGDATQNLQTLAIFNTFTYGGIGGTQATTSGGSRTPG